MNGMPILAHGIAHSRPLEYVGARRTSLTPLAWLMGFYVFFFPIQFGAETINFAPSDLFLGSAVLFCGLRLRLIRAAWSFLHLALVLVFFSAAGISVYLHGDLSTYVIVKIVGLLTLLASYLCLTNAADRWGEIERLARIFIVATSLHCLIAVVALKTGFSANWMNYGNLRVSGMLLDPNAFGGLVLVALLIQIGTYLGGRVAIPGVWGIAATLSLSVGLFLTLSRSAWIGFFFGFILISMLRPRAWVIGVVFTAALAGGTWLWIESQQSAKNEILLERENTAMQRIDQIRQALPMFASHPVLGIGMGEFDLRSDPAGFHPMIIHNTTVWILTEFGLIGLTVYLAFMGWFFRRGWMALRLADARNKPLVIGLLGAHAGMLGLSTGIEVLYQRHWWLVMALLAASAVLASRDAAFNRDAGL